MAKIQLLNGSTKLDDLKSMLAEIKLKNDKAANSKGNVQADDNLLAYLYNIVKPVKSDNKKIETSSDDESIYEDENTVAKTIFRSSSFDEPLDELSTSQQTLEESTDSKSHNSTKSKTFSLHDLSDSFNISSDDEENNLQDDMTCLEPEQFDKVVVEKVTEIAQKIQKGKIEEEYPSISSSTDSIKFDDVIAGDILGELEVEEKADTLDAQESQLSIDERKIVNVIVKQLKEQLKPTLKTLSEESQKYELAKTIYKLPSISKLNPQIRDQSIKRIKQRKVKLEFHEDIIKSMVETELQKKQNRKAKALLVSESDQVRLNFNKFRHLNTIIEQPSLENSRDTIKLYKCNASNYDRQKDTRSIEMLETEELHSLLKRLEEEKLEETKVSKLISLFEPKSKRICKQTNQELKHSILEELQKRSV